jgi:hypothetical protein
MGMTPFSQNYLHISSLNNDQKQTSVTGMNQFSGLGPYSLTYPFINYSDVVNPDGQGKVSFTGNKGNTAVSYDGTIFNTVFFGYPFESISSLPNRSGVMERIVDFFGGCEQPVSVTIEPPSQVQTSLPGSEVVYQFEVTNTGDYIDTFSLSLGGIWPASLPGGDSTGPLSPGEAATVIVLVTVPGSMAEGGTDVTTLTATSGLIRYAADSAKMTTRASFFIYPTFFPIISK